MAVEDIRVTVQCRSEGRQREATAIAKRLGASCVDGNRVSPGEYRIVLLENGSQLWDEHSRRRGMPLDFHKVDRRTNTGSLSKKQPIARAIGKSARTIVDATAGLGHDAFLLACMGWEVTAVERHPVIGLLLEESIHAAMDDVVLSESIGNRLRFQIGDARTYLVDPVNTRPDVVYLDPMFQPSRSTALPRKPAQVLRRLVGQDDDSIELFEIARCRALQHVVVKRSDDSPPLVEGVDRSHRGKIARYDVYTAGVE